MQQSKGWRPKAKEVAETQDSKNQKSFEVPSAGQKVVRWRWGLRRRCARGREGRTAKLESSSGRKFHQIREGWRGDVTRKERRG